MPCFINRKRFAVRQDREGLAALLQVKGDAVGHGEFAEEIAERPLEGNA
jgi:hypothetical protein